MLLISRHSHVLLHQWEFKDRTFLLKSEKLRILLKTLSVVLKAFPHSSKSPFTKWEKNVQALKHSSCFGSSPLNQAGSHLCFDTDKFWDKVSQNFIYFGEILRDFSTEKEINEVKIYNHPKQQDKLSFYRNWITRIFLLLQSKKEVGTETQNIL